MKRLLILAAGLIIFLFVFSAITDRFSNQKDTENVNDKVRVLTQELVVIEAVERVGPSVVAIAEESKGIFRRDQEILSYFGIEELPEEDAGPDVIGSGFIVSSDGLIVTNKHVVLDDGVDYKVITSSDKTYDVAILKINANNLKPIEFGSSKDLKIGQFAIAIGSALGEFRNSVTTGMISGLGRRITAGSFFEGYAEELDDVIQTDAAINPGNSGGPLLNSSSQVIGVNTAVTAGGQNIGFALPIDVIKASIDTFNKGGQFERAYFGVSYIMIKPEMAEETDLASGALVESVSEGSPAADAGITRSDIITHIDNKKITKDTFELSQAISENKAGDEVTLKVWRDGEVRDVKATLESTP